MNKYNIVKIFGLLSIVALLSACLSKVTFEEGLVTTKNEAAIQAYIKSKNLTMTQSGTGLYYTITKAKADGRTCVSADTIRLQYVISLLDGTKVDSSTINNPYKFVYSAASPILFKKLIPLMKEGEQATFVIASELAGGTQAFTSQNIPANSPLRIDITYYYTNSEEADIDRYVRDTIVNKLKYTLTEKVDYGIRYIRTREGTGDYPASGKIAKVKYTGYLLNGKKFDSNYGKNTDGTEKDSLDVTIGSSSGFVTGFLQGVNRMKKGEKATVIFPSSLGYSTSGKGSIPANTPLRFDLEIIDFKDN